MGLKELSHLKDTLSKIKEKNAKISESEDKLKQLKSERSNVDLMIQEWESSIEKKKIMIKKLEKESTEFEALTEAEEKELVGIEEEISKIQKIIIDKEKAFDERNDRLVLPFILIVAAYVLIPIIGGLIQPGLVVLWFGDESTEFECDNGKIIPASYVNNDYNECGDNSDEDVEETDELKDAIEKSNREENTAVFSYCCLIPMILYFVGNSLGNDAAKVRLSIDEKIKQKELNEQKKPLEMKRGEYNHNSTVLNTKNNELTSAIRILKSQQSKLFDTSISIDQTKSEIARLKDEIDEHYESIKHLIPFSDKIDE